MGRAPCCEKVGIKRGRWTAEEDDILTKYIQANGEGLWRSLPKNAGLPRCGKSCRLRWINYLRSDVKRGNISAEEEQVIIKLHSSLGNRWSVIAGHMPGRTDNEIKNYWNSHLSRKIQRPSNDTPPPPVVDVDSAKEEGIPNKRRGGRTSRSAVKKTKTYIPTSAPKEPSEHFVNGITSMPPTPSLEEEALSCAISWQEEIMGDISVLEPSPLVPSPLGSCEERESLVLCSDDGKVDWNWNWDGGDAWVEEDKMLSWLWESTENGEGDCNEVRGEIDSEKQNAMVAWLFS